MAASHCLADCLMNYHEECKEKVTQCPKQKARDRKVGSTPLLSYYGASSALQSCK